MHAKKFPTFRCHGTTAAAAAAAAAATTTSDNKGASGPGATNRNQNAFAFWALSPRGPFKLSTQDTLNPSTKFAKTPFEPRGPTPHIAGVIVQASVDHT